MENHMDTCIDIKDQTFCLEGSKKSPSISQKPLEEKSGSKAYLSVYKNGLEHCWVVWMLGRLESHTSCR